MVMVPIDDDRGRFRVVVWKNENADEEPVAYSDLTEAKESFAKLREGCRYYYGELVEWVDHYTPLKLLDSWEHERNQAQEPIP
jgi:hypothetical protein